MSFSNEAKKIDRFFRERSKLLKVNFDTVNFQTVQTGTPGGPGSFLAVDSNKNLILSSPASSTSFNDDVKVFFGNDSDAFIEFNEDGDDFLVISGSSAGIVLSGSTIQIDGTLEGASPLRIGGEVQFVSSGDNVAFNFGPNNESKIFLVMTTF